MRKTIIVLILLIGLSFPVVAGGLFTNTNQSALWVRMLVRDAATGVDAVYYNPAGLAKLNNGFHLSLNNQFITQTKDVTNSLPTLHDGFYRGDVKAPVFPGLYAVFKKNKWAVSFGFNPVGGGGGATYDRGLPSFEMDISGLVPQLSGLSALGLNVTDYSADIFFEGTSVFFGAQLGVTYAINDMISVFAGGRYILANNSYEGYLKNISVTANGEEHRADWWLINAAVPTVNGAATQATVGAGSATGAANAMQPLIDGGYGGMTFAEAEGATVINSDTRALLEGGLIALGFTQPQVDAMTLQVAQGSYTGAAAQLTTLAAQLTATSTVLTGTASQLADKEVETKQKGTGITPVFGIHFQPTDNLAIAVKYEHHTKIELTNETKHDDVNMFPDDAKVRSDMPGMLSVGVNYSPLSKLTLAGGLHYYFDKPAYYGKYEVDVEGNPVIDDDGVSWVMVNNEDYIDKGYMEYGLGIEYGLMNKLDVSLGFLRAVPGVKDNYQTDLSYGLTSSTVSGGFTYRLSDMIGLTLGVGYSFYEDQTLDYTHDLGDYTQKYEKANTFVGFGVDLHF